MIKAVIVDDEKHSCEMLEWQIKEFYPDCKIAGIFSSPEQALQEIPRLKPDLLFLDVEMPKLNGFELLSKLNEISFEIIFTTAYDQYAIKAMKHSALDYLLKPIDKDELLYAFEKFSKKQSNTTREQITFLLSQIENLNKKKKLNRIAISTVESVTFLEYDEIVYCESDSNYTHIHLNNGTSILTSKTLKLLEEVLHEDYFVRVSQSYLANLTHVKKLVKEDGGYLLMSNGKSITISKNKKDELFDHFDKF